LPALLVSLVALVAACGESNSSTPTPTGSAGERDGAAGDSAMSSGGQAGEGALTCVDVSRSAPPPPCNGQVQELANRPYCLKVPASYSADSPAPLLLLLHGFNASGQIQADYFDFDALAERHGFLLAKPDGAPNLLGSKYWNASPACCAPKVGNVPDDVAYLTALLDDVEARFSVDASRVYAVGHSNGGFMAHRLACDISPRLAGVVSLAGVVDLDSCTPGAPISILQVHGTTDALVHYEGGTLATMSAAYPSVDATLAFWRNANGCSAPRDSSALDLDCNTEAAGVETERITSDCADGTSTELWRMTGVGHIPSFILPTWPERVYDFLSHQRRQ
jgi:polyhydroxybutyrate depolymerase